MDGQLLKKYFRGACTTSEELEVLRWFKNKNLNPEQEEHIYRIWRDTDEESFDLTADRDRADIFDRILLSTEEKEPETSDTYSEIEYQETTVGRWRGLWWYGVAAAMFLIVGRLVFVSQIQQTETVKLLQASAPYGTRKVVKLDDGSLVHLNSGSRITYPERFKTKKREIGLIGEAFFTVKQDSLRPFIIQSGHLLTQVTGTSFNIKYRQNAENLVVSLATGSVKIRQIGGKKIGQTAQLVPGQQLVYTENKAAFEVRAFNRDEVLSWQRGILNFRQSSLTEVVEKLENWYGVRVELRGKRPANKNEWKYSGTYDNQVLGNTLAGISFVKNFAYEIKNNVVIIDLK